MKKNSFATTLLVGAASAVAALLFAPKSGKELREDLKEEAKKLKQSGQEKAENLSQDVKQSYYEAEAEMNYYPTNSDETDLSESVELNQNNVQSTVEKGEEWLDQVGEQQDMVATYPDSSTTTPAGTFGEDATSLPAEAHEAGELEKLPDTSLTSNTESVPGVSPELDPTASLESEREDNQD